MRVASLIAALGFASLAACSPAATSEGDTVTVTDAYIVKPTPGRDVAGGGLTLTVKGAPAYLVGADTDIADTVELQTMEMTTAMEVEITTASSTMRHTFSTLVLTAMVTMQTAQADLLTFLHSLVMTTASKLLML